MTLYLQDGCIIFPPEIICAIAENLDDKSLREWCLADRDVYESIYTENAPIWRAKFYQHFDGLLNLDNSGLKRTYTYRKPLLKKTVNFRIGKTASERECLVLVRDLIIESCKHKNVNRAVSQNLATIKEYLTRTNLFRDFNLARYAFRNFDPLMPTIQLVLAHLFFDPIVTEAIRSLPLSQYNVYQAPCYNPLFVGAHNAQVNIKWFNHALNIFKGSFRSDYTGRTWRLFRELTPSERPQAWSMPLSPTGAYKVGRNWLGCICWPDGPNEAFHLRNTEAFAYNGTFDAFSYNHTDELKFGKLDIRYPQDPSKFFFPNHFEAALRSKTHPSTKYLSGLEKEALNTRQDDGSSPPATGAKIQSQKRSAAHSPQDKKRKRKRGKGSQEQSDGKQSPTVSSASIPFKGINQEDEDYLLVGYLNPLPAQDGIPGFMRISLAKFVHRPEIDPRTASAMRQRAVNNALDSHCENDAALHKTLEDQDEDPKFTGYEGVVLPGGKIMIGRWWDASTGEPGDGIGLGPRSREGPMCGAFIYWCVD